MSDLSYCPKLISEHEIFLRNSIEDDGILVHRHGFIKNLGYNLQYLEYLYYTSCSGRLHSTVNSLTTKTFVITGISIIEAILWYVLKKNDLHTKIHWEKIKEFKCNEYSDHQKKRRQIVIIEEKYDTPKEAEMTLDVMRKKVEAKKLLGVKEQVYKDINHLRKLRNKIHIHVLQNDKDTDWFKFNSKDISLVKKTLYSILTCELFSNSIEHVNIYDYLKETPNE